MESDIGYLLNKEDMYRMPDIGGHAKEWGTRNLLGFHVYIKGTHALGKGTISITLTPLQTLTRLLTLTPEDNRGRQSLGKPNGVCFLLVRRFQALFNLN